MTHMILYRKSVKCGRPNGVSQFTYHAQHLTGYMQHASKTPPSSSKNGPNAESTK